MWAVVAFLSVVVTAWLVGISWFAWLAAFHDGLPVVLAGAWIAMVYGAVTRQWFLAAGGGVLVLFHLAITVPRMFSATVPDWVAGAPRITVAAANVFVGNRTPDASAAGLVATHADVLVVSERNDAFMHSLVALDDAGDYAHHLDEVSDTPDYATSIAARIALLDGSEVVYTDSMAIVRAVVACGDQRLQILGVHLRALTTPNGFGAWRTELIELERFLQSVRDPHVVVGDFNATQFLPAFARFLRVVRLRSAHDAVGKGLTGSLKPGAHGWLGRFPALGRVDHALCSIEVFPVRVENRNAAGSDHRPFVVTLAVNPAAIMDRA